MLSVIKHAMDTIFLFQQHRVPAHSAWCVQHSWLLQCKTPSSQKLWPELVSSAEINSIDCSTRFMESYSTMLMSIHGTHAHACMHAHTHTHLHLTTPLSRTTWVSRYQKGKNNLDFIEARDSEWQWHQLGHMQVCTSLQTDNHTSTPPLSFLQTRCLHAAQPTESKH